MPKKNPSQSPPTLPPAVESSSSLGKIDGGAGLPQLVEVKLIDVDVESRHLDRSRIEALAASIQRDGLLHPITVFQKPGGRYSLGPGRHRLEAHKHNGEQYVRAFVRREADLQTIRLCQAIENLQRKDMTPIEEAASCQVIVEHEGGDVDKAAAMLGVEKRWLDRRLSLNRLSPRVQQLLLDGDIYLKHAELLARLVDHDKQEEIAGRYKGGPDRWDKKRINNPEPEWKWREAVEAELRSLRDVTWRLDAEFAGKPACTSCPHNSANAPTLFEGEKITKALCLFAPCYAVKSKACSSAVVKASNTLVQLGLPTSPKAAEKAIAEREVPFVAPKAVADRAKRLQQDAKKPTKAETKGSVKAIYDYAAAERWRNEHGKWAKNLEAAIHGRIVDLNDPLMAGSIAMLSMHPAISDLEEPLDYDGRPVKPGKKSIAAEKLIARLAGLAAAAQWEDICIEVHAALLKRRAGAWYLDPFGSSDDFQDAFNAIIAKAIGLEVPPEPSYDSVNKPAASKAEPTPAATKTLAKKPQASKTAPKPKAKPAAKGKPAKAKPAPVANPLVFNLDLPAKCKLSAQALVCEVAPNRWASGFTVCDLAGKKPWEKSKPISATTRGPSSQGKIGAIGMALDMLLTALADEEQRRKGEDRSRFTAAIMAVIEMRASDVVTPKNSPMPTAETDGKQNGAKGGKADKPTGTAKPAADSILPCMSYTVPLPKSCRITAHVHLAEQEAEAIFASYSMNVNVPGHARLYGATPTSESRCFAVRADAVNEMLSEIHQKLSMIAADLEAKDEDGVDLLHEAMNELDQLDDTDLLNKGKPAKEALPA